MAIVILHRAALASFPYYEWLKERGQALHLIVSASKLAAFDENVSDLPCGAYASVHVIEDYDVNGDVERLVLDIHAQDPVSAIVAQAEFDIERAARLRAYLDLPGQSKQSAFVFRNKVAMKECARAAGIAVANWIALNDTLQLLDFVKKVGFPVVVKPQNGAGSFNVRLLHNINDLNAFIATGFTPPLDMKPNMMIESFVTGKTYHIDGLVVNGRIVMNWPSIYETASLDFLDADGEANASYLLEPENPLTDRLRIFIATILAAFPTPKNTTFHAEVFHTDNGELVLCEIASRTGGARINDTITACFGVNISEQWARVECGLSQTFLDENRLPQRLGGWVLVAPRPGVVSRCPDHCDLSNVVDFANSVKKGQVLSRPTAATECIASFVFHADSEAASRDAIKSCRSWFYSKCGIDKK